MDLFVKAPPTFLFVLLLIGFNRGEECQRRDYGNGGHVCVCNSTYCDTISRPTPVKRPNYLIYTSNKAGLRFSQTSSTFTRLNLNPRSGNQIVIKSSKRYQNIIGWGGAFTDATGINIASLSEAAQENLLKSYFSEDGIEYNLGRVPVAGTDFSTRAYSYDDGPSDPTLTNFQLQPEDYLYKIPFIKRANDLTDGNLQLFASAWKAPDWMKTTDQYLGGTFIKSSMYQIWANYYIRFFDEYLNEGIVFWGVTTENEPIFFLLPLGADAVAWTPLELHTWIVNNFGPTIRNSSHSDIKILVFDDQRLFLPWLQQTILSTESARRYVDGIAVHWYYDTYVPAHELSVIHKTFPDKFILYTEACILKPPNTTLGSWEHGEEYSANIIEDVNNWVEGWTDWNMALDYLGGPTYTNNNVNSPIIVNATADEFYKQPMFYNLGHFSKFVPRGSRRIGSSTFDENNVPVAAFRTPDHATVVVILNKNEDVASVALTDAAAKGGTHIILSAKSITTILYW